MNFPRRRDSKTGDQDSSEILFVIQHSQQKGGWKHARLTTEFEMQCGGDALSFCTVITAISSTMEQWQTSGLGLCELSLWTHWEHPGYTKNGNWYRTPKQALTGQQLVFGENLLLLANDASKTSLPHIHMICYYNTFDILSIEILSTDQAWILTITRSCRAHSPWRVEKLKQGVLGFTVV